VALPAGGRCSPFGCPRALTVLHHQRQELDEHLGGGAQQHLLLAALLRVVHGLLRGTTQTASGCTSVSTASGGRRGAGRARRDCQRPAARPLPAASCRPCLRQKPSSRLSRTLVATGCMLHVWGSSRAAAAPLEPHAAVSSPQQLPGARGCPAARSSSLAPRPPPSECSHGRPSVPCPPLSRLQHPLAPPVQACPLPALHPALHPGSPAHRRAQKSASSWRCLQVPLKPTGTAQRAERGRLRPGAGQSCARALHPSQRGTVYILKPLSSPLQLYEVRYYMPRLPLGDGPRAGGLALHARRHMCGRRQVWGTPTGAGAERGQCE
jgi:hypothetical protein